MSKVTDPMKSTTIRMIHYEQKSTTFHEILIHDLNMRKNGYEKSHSGTRGDPKNVYLDLLQESFDMWLWGRIIKVKWIDRAGNDKLLMRIRDERKLLKVIKKNRKYFG